MKMLYALTHALVQSALTEVLLLAWQLWQISDLSLAMGSTATLLLFLSIYNIVLSILFRSLGYWTRFIITSLGSSLLVAATFAIYPELGFGVDWYIMFAVLLLANVMAHMFLYGSGARMRNSGGTDYEYE